MMRFVSSIITLFITYLILTGNATLSNLIAGLLVSLGISLLMPKEAPMLIRLDRLPRFLWAGTRYLFVVMQDVILGGISTARIVLSPKMPIKPGILAIASGSKTELATAFSAHAYAMSPGEVVIEIDSDGVLYTHCLDVETTAAAADEARARRNRLLSSMYE